MNESIPQKPLRLWPGVVLVVIQWLAWLVVPMVAPVPEFKMYGVMVGLLLGPFVLLWWVFFSRALWTDRLGAVLLAVAAMAAAQRLVHPSVGEGNLGFQYFIYAIPVACLAFVAWAVVSRHLSARLRRASMVVVILFGCGMWVLLRSDGLTGDGFPEFAWRWSETPEERLLAQEGNEFAALPPDAQSASAEVAWPGFRGPDRDGVVRGVRIGTDWSASPPAELWRRPVGPGVSAFAVGGGLLYTQEQRGEDEVVSCYKVTTGEPVWRHRDAARFWDSHVGAGPRATPALGQGRVYALGATGILNALDARSGTVVWSRNAGSDTGGGVPYFGYVNSPLVVDQVVIVNTRELVAYDLATGDRRWHGPNKGVSYSSPHRLTLGGVPQVLMLRPGSVTSLAPEDGSLLWQYRLGDDITSVLQPAQIADGVLISTMVGSSAVPQGIHRITVAKGSEGWTAEERWMSKRLKPSFSQIVVHAGHAFGFDGRILACIGLEDGQRKWKGGRYGSGQLLLLPDQDLLLVLSERGEVALVTASPDQFTELARFAAIEGRMWSQPALVDGILLVRNGQEMAAFRLPSAIDQVER